MGRFINADSEFDENARFLGNNLFTYCANSPNIYKDITGEGVVLTCVLIGTAIGALLGGAVGAGLSEYNLGYIDLRWVAGGVAVGGAVGSVAGWGIGSVASAIGIGTVSKITGSLTPGLYHSWQQAEQALRNAYNGIKQAMSTDYGTRFIDCFSNGIAREAKFGYQSLSQRILCEIEKDVWLVTNGFVDSVEWHFYWSDISNTGGASQPLIDALMNAGIEIFFH